MCNKEVFKSNVAHSVADTRDLCVLDEKTDKIVVSSTAEHCSVVFGSVVKYLENSTCVIVKSADYSEIEYAVFVKSCLFESFEKADELGGACGLGADRRRVLDVHCVERVDLGYLLIGKTELTELLFVGVAGDLVLAVDDLGDLARTLGICSRNSGDHVVEEAAVVDVNGEHRLVRTVCLEYVDRAGDTFKICLVGIASEDVDVYLPELAETSSLGTLVAVHIGNREPLEREIELTHLTCDHTGNAGGHFGTDSKSAVTAVGKVVGLFVRDLLTALCGIEFERLEHRSVVFLEGSKFKCLADLTEEPVAETHILGIKITCTLIGLGRKKLCAHI